MDGVCDRGLWVGLVDGNCGWGLWLVSGWGLCASCVTPAGS